MKTPRKLVEGSNLALGSKSRKERGKETAYAERGRRRPLGILQNKVAVSMNVRGWGTTIMRM